MEPIVIVIIIVIYFIPSLVGLDKKHTSGIFILNLFLGWTLLGWVVALIWAVSDSAQTKENSNIEDVKKCPFCAERIQHDAVKCRYCGSDLPKDCAEIVAKPLREEDSIQTSTFRYRAKESNGTDRHGEITATDERNAVKKLQKEGLIIISLDMVKKDI